MPLRVSGIRHLNLTVADLDRALAFYRDALGFETVFSKEATVWLAAGGDLLGLSQGEPSPGSGFEHFGFQVDDPGLVDTWAEQLRSSGISVEKGPYDRSDGRSVYFRDPDGYLLEIFYLAPALRPGGANVPSGGGSPPPR